MIRKSLPLAAAAALAAAPDCPADIAGVTHGRVGVVQNDPDNDQTSVTLTVEGGSRSFGLRGGNRGDFDVTFGTPNDVDSGVMITSVRQNGRNNVAGGGVDGISYGTSAAAESSGRERYFIPAFASGGSAEASGMEFNIDVAAGHFRFDRYLGGVAENSANGGPITQFRGSAGINLGTQFVDGEDGTFTVDLRDLGGDSRTGILLAVGAKNEDNFALSQANDDGTFTIFNHDNGANGRNYEQDPVGFAFLGEDVFETSGGLITAGRVLGTGAVELASGLFNVARIGTGQLFLDIAGQTAETGTLLITAGGGEFFNVDNIVSYEAFNNGGTDGWLIETRDLGGAMTGLQDVFGNADFPDEEAFSFAFIADAPAAVPEPATTALIGFAALGAACGARRRRRATA